MHKVVQMQTELQLEKNDSGMFAAVNQFEYFSTL